MNWSTVATVVLVLHFTYVGYVVVGGFLAWRWPRAIVPHLAAVAWGALIVLEWVNCPLTWAEDRARDKAGQSPLTQGFVDRYLDNVLYPARYLNEVRLGVALMIGVSWLGAYLLWKRRRLSEQGASPEQGDTSANSAADGGRAATV